LRTQHAFFLFLLAFLIFGCDRIEHDEFSATLGGYDAWVTSNDDQDLDLARFETATEATGVLWGNLKPHESGFLAGLNDSEAGEVIHLSNEGAFVKSLFEYSDQCYGAFDPTLQILWDVYDFDLGGRYVSDEELSDALELVDSSLIEITDESILRKDENARMGFGPTMQGALTDGYVIAFTESDYSYSRIHVDHSLYYSTLNETDWDYEFKYPLDAVGPDEIQLDFGTIRLIPGDYLAAMDNDENGFFAHGNFYHMVLSPVDGRPVDGIKCAIVVSRESCLQASVFSYALMVMGVDRGMEFLDEMEGVEGLMLTDDDEILVSGGLADRFWR